MKINDCPFCHNAKKRGTFGVVVNFDSKESYANYVECGECLATGPKEDTTKDAIISWNKSALATTKQ